MSDVKQYITIPTGWAIYEVDGDVKVVDAKGREAVPPHVAMETLVLAGKAKRLAIIQSIGDGATIDMEVEGDDDGGEHPGAESERLWFDPGE